MAFLSASIGLALCFLQVPQGRGLPSAKMAGELDVPLERLPDAEVLQETAGVSFLDYDSDGWIDLYVNRTAELWRNLEGNGFTRAADLDAFLPRIESRYGAACGDFDNDGLVDIACEPRHDCFYLLRNLDGAGRFVEIARDPELVLDPPSCGMFAETFCWADLDEDGDLDLWLPAYPDSVVPRSGGNQFFENLGPTGPGGAYRLARRTEESGLGILEGASQPEGAQFVDLDRDGDMDGFACGTIYQNVTGTEGPRFRPLAGVPTGIPFPSSVDEGALFFDYDLDGDEDLLVLHFAVRSVIWENEGDGTFHEASDVIEQPHHLAFVGCSAEDWDLDGDLDISAGPVFRRNLLVESGERFLRLASHSLDGELLVPIPTWGDWDKDGDVDCVLSNHNAQGYFLRNTTYGPSTEKSQRLSVRVRPVRDSASVPRGLETEFGATVELRVHGDPSGFVRRRFVASSHGYLQQNEYALSMALPRGPDPEAPARGVVFDLLVDFPSLPANGVLRIDSSVNPVLGDLELAALSEREITVFRSGRVRLDGVDFPPRAALSPRLASTGALVLPVPDEPLAEPAPAVQDRWSVGMEVDTFSAEGPVHVQELVLDGQLTPAGGANVLLYDVTRPRHPRLVRGEECATSPRNDRSFLPLDWQLQPRHVYRVLCRVTELRASPRLEGALGAELANRGALSFACSGACSPAEVAGAVLDPASSYLELRYRITAGSEQR